MSPERDLRRLRRRSSFILSWVILHFPGGALNMTQFKIFSQNRRNILKWVKSTNENKLTSCCLSHKNTCLVLVQKAAIRVGGLQLFYQVRLRLPALSIHFLGYSLCWQRKQDPAGLLAWRINSEGPFLYRGRLRGS